jgi:hypothetical protein
VHSRLRGLLGETGGVAGMPGELIGEHLIAVRVYDGSESVQSVTAENSTGWLVTF